MVTPYTCPTTTYTGLSHTATYTITGVNGETGATVGTVDVSNTTHTNAGTYTSDSVELHRHGQLQQLRTARSPTASPRPTRRWWLRRTPVPRRPTRALRTRRPTSITGVNGETGATVGTVDVSNTTHTNAGTYANDPGASQARPTTTTSATRRSPTASPRRTRRWWSRRTPVPRRPTRALRTRRPYVDHRCERRDWSHGGHG